MAQPSPVAALRRMAFLLERAREDTYKVKAYRNAAATLLPLSDDEVSAHVEAEPGIVAEVGERQARECERRSVDHLRTDQTRIGIRT